MRDAGNLIVRRYFEELLNDATFDVAAEILTADFKFFGPVSQRSGLDIEGLAQFVRMLRRAFPDKYFIQLDQFGESERICSRFRMTGTHLGPFQGVGPTKKKIFIEGADVFHLRDGKIARAYAYFDLMALLAQLGVAPDMDLSLDVTGLDSDALGTGAEGITHQETELVSCEEERSW